MKRRIISASDFHRIVKSGEAVDQENTVIRKQTSHPASVIKRADVGMLFGEEVGARIQAIEDRYGSKLPDELLQVWKISSRARDRDNDIVKGKDWTNFRKNPVVLWAHAHHLPPVAQSAHEWEDGDDTFSLAVFTPKDVSDYGYMIGRMSAMGFMRAASIGFLAKQYEVDDELRDRDDKFGLIFDLVEILEWSTVDIPANQEAVRGAKDAGIDLAPMKSLVSMTLDLMRQEASDDLDRALYETAWKTINGGVIVVPSEGANAESGSKTAEAEHEKRGRVLSKANEAKLQKAYDELGEVLSAVKVATEDPETETETEETDNDKDSIPPRTKGEDGLDLDLDLDPEDGAGDDVLDLEPDEDEADVDLSGLESD